MARLLRPASVREPIGETYARALRDAAYATSSHQWRTRDTRLRPGSSRGCFPESTGGSARAKEPGRRRWVVDHTLFRSPHLGNALSDRHCGAGPKSSRRRCGARDRAVAHRWTRLEYTFGSRIARRTNRALCHLDWRQIEHIPRREVQRKSARARDPRRFPLIRSPRILFVLKPTRHPKERARPHRFGTGVLYLFFLPATTLAKFSLLPIMPFDGSLPSLPDGVHDCG
jgi:hypothetical protein